MKMRATLILYLAPLIPAPCLAETIAYSWSSDIYGGDEIVYEIVLETGQATPLGVVNGRDIDGGCSLPDGRVVGIDGYNAEYWQMLPTGQLLGAPIMAGVDAGMCFDVTSDTLYATSAGTMSDPSRTFLYSVDPDDGTTSLIGVEVDYYTSALAINFAGEAFAIDNTFTNRLYSVDLDTGQLTPGPTIHRPSGGTILGTGGAAFAPDGTLWFTRPTYGEIYKLDPITGLATYVSTISVQQPGYRWNFLAIPIPEPTTAGLLMLASCMLRCRKRS